MVYSVYINLRRVWTTVVIEDVMNELPEHSEVIFKDINSESIPENLKTVLALSDLAIYEGDV